MNYQDFLKNKRFVLESSGFDIDKSELNPKMYDFQKDVVRWALKKGKACIFADCGLGKTLMQLEWDGYMVVSMAMLSLCDTIYMLKGWEDSDGAKEELQYALEHGYKVIIEK